MQPSLKLVFLLMLFYTSAIGIKALSLEKRNSPVPSALLAAASATDLTDPCSQCPCNASQSAPTVVWFTALCDILIALSYFAIPIAIIYFQRTIKQPFHYSYVLVLFELFIFSCGMTHFFAAFWYWSNIVVIMAVMKCVTAGISIMAAVALSRVFPQAFALPAHAQRLEEELGVRIHHEQALQLANDLLIRFRRITHRIRRTLDVSTICHTAVNELAQTLQCESVGLFIMSPSGQGEYQCQAECHRLQPDTGLALAAGQRMSDVLYWRSIHISADTRIVQRLSRLSYAAYLSERDMSDFMQGQKSTLHRAGMLIGFSLPDKTKKAFVLIGSRDASWSLPEKEIELVEDVVGQVAIALNQTVQLENETSRLAQLEHQLRLNADLDRAKQAAEATSRMKSDFLATMSHEIRTPLNAIMGFVSLLQQSSGLTTDQREIVETVASSSQVLLTLLNDILDFTKIESGYLQLEQERFSLRHCLENALHLLASQADTRHLHLNYFLHPQVPSMVIGDRTRLRQILVNLVSNALKFTEGGEVYVIVTLESNPPVAERMRQLPGSSRYDAVGGENVPLSVVKKASSIANALAKTPGNSARHSESSLVQSDPLQATSSHTSSHSLKESQPPTALVSPISPEGNEESEENVTSAATEIYFHVIDTGIGIREDRLRTLFQKFAQVDSSISRRYGGTGLGLAISARLVQMQQGKIWVQSCVGQGSIFTFSVRLPVDTGASPVMAADIARSLVAVPPIVLMTENGASYYLNLPPCMIMIVSHWTTTRDTTVQLLQSVGLNGSSFSSLHDALMYLKTCSSQGKRAVLLLDEDTLAEESQSKQFLDQMLSLSCSCLMLARSKHILVGHEWDPYFMRLCYKPCKLESLLIHLKETLESGDIQMNKKDVDNNDMSMNNAAKTSNSSTSVPTETLNLTTAPPHSTQHVSSMIGKDLRILVVDDNAINRRVMQRHLKVLGVECIEEAANGFEALNWVQKAPFDVVFMDVAMPEMDGLTATRTILSIAQRKGNLDGNNSALGVMSHADIESATGSVTEVVEENHEAETNPPAAISPALTPNFHSTTSLIPFTPWIIAMTASAMNEERRICLDAGMNDFLAKPLTQADLLLVLNRFLKQGRRLPNGA